jgi:hypothetical protein
MRKLVIAAAMAAVAATAAAPAEARHRYRDRHHADVDAGDVIAGAIVVGGIAALLSKGSNEASRRRQDAAVDLCSSEAESRTGDRVSAITGVSKRRGYYTVSGELDRDGAGYGDRFRCTIRNGTIYSFDLRPDGA